jgi:hypothetical protein
MLRKYFKFDLNDMQGRLTEINQYKTLQAVFNVNWPIFVELIHTWTDNIRN